MDVSRPPTKAQLPTQSYAFPEKLEGRFLSRYEKLSHEQAGHIRHFHNLSSQRDGAWDLMGSQEPGQEWLDAYRYQLATMAYAVAVTHYHRLPALRSPFKRLMQRLIHKMLRREVWGYWFLTSHSGKFVDPDIKELRKPWADPIIKENIMYSGHLLLMVSLYTMLFDDDRYNEPDALTFVWDPVFWGMGPEKFTYTRQSLQKAILDEMERENWLGVCCEPNSISVVCNQFPILAFRYNDIQDGTQIAESVLERYTAAWKKVGMTHENGLFVNWYCPKQKRRQLATDIGNTAWGAAFMNAWNPNFAKETFHSQTVGFISRTEEGRMNVNSGPVAFTIRDLVNNNGAEPFSPETARHAREIILGSTGHLPDFPLSRPTFGYTAMCASEVGDGATLEGLLSHADAFFQPTWHWGGLYYPCNEVKSDKDDNWTQVDPFTGNAAVAYARLNVPDGQRKMWTKPWTSEHLQNYPFIDGIDLDSGVDFLRAYWDESCRAMVITLRSWNGEPKSIDLQCCNLPIGRYGIYHNGELARVHEVADVGESVQMQLGVNEEFNIVLMQSQ